MPDNADFDLDDAFQHTTFMPEDGFKDTLRSNLQQRYEQRKKTHSSSGVRRFLIMGRSSQPTSDLSRAYPAQPSRVIPAFTLGFIVLLVIALGAAITVPSLQVYLSSGTATAVPSATPSESPTNDEAVITITPDLATDTPTIATESAAPTEPPQGELVVGCSETRLSGVVEIDAPYVRIQITLASNLMEPLAATVVPVTSEGGYEASLTYPTQAAETRLIVSVGEWDGTQYLRPADMNGADCVD